jgi:lipopolysaccharide assembly protein B
MSDLTLLTGLLVVVALVIGILAGHFGWGRRWPQAAGKLHPDYLTGLDFLVTEQPDRALDMFLKLMDANADTIETHFALGALYRRRGEVERAIRIHQNLLARESLAPEHREQALLALARDYLRAGVLDRAEQLLLQVSEVPRLRGNALDALRGVYERQHEWAQALHMYRALAKLKAAPSANIAAHYLCELAQAALEQGDMDSALKLLREAETEVTPFARAALLRAAIARKQQDLPSALRLLRSALEQAPVLLQHELPNLLSLVDRAQRDALLHELAQQAARDPAELKSLVFAAFAADLGTAAPLRAAIEAVFTADPALHVMWSSEPKHDERLALEMSALLAHAETYRCNECGFAGRSFYWQCPACHTWDSFEAHAVVKLR